MTYAEILRSHGENKEATAYPFWAIVHKSGFGRFVLLDGIWFNREDAERFLKATAYNYPKTAFVYCFSGNRSWHLKELFTKADADLGAPSESSLVNEVAPLSGPQGENQKEVENENDQL